jgi:hypothetical protein
VKRQSILKDLKAGKRLPLSALEYLSNTSFNGDASIQK